MKIINLNDVTIINLVTMQGKVYAVTAEDVEENVLPKLQLPLFGYSEVELTLQLFDVGSELAVGEPLLGEYASSNGRVYVDSENAFKYPSPDGWTNTKTTKQNLKAFGGAVVHHKGTSLVIPSRFRYEDDEDEYFDLTQAYRFFLKIHGFKNKLKRGQFLIIKDGKAEAFQLPTNDVLIAAALTESNACVATRHTIFTIDL